MVPLSGMNARERVLAAIHRQPFDRVPTDIWATGEVWQRLRERFGTDAEVRAALHIDGMAGVGPAYIGPTLVAPPGENCDYWGIRTRPMAYATGVYDEYSCHPLASATTIDDLEAYPWPQAEWFDFSTVREQALAGRRTQAVAGGYMAPFYQHNKLRGLELSLMDPVLAPEFTHHLLRRTCDFIYAYHQRLFEAADGLIDLAQVTDDLGSQTGPLISLALYREFYAPHHQRFIDLCRQHNVRVMHHDDGAMRDFLPDLVNMGIEILNPVQWNCPGMDAAALKRDFGDRLAFHGGIENQRILPFGSPAEVRAEVRHCIDSLANDGTGYILAPCHNIQPVTPMENIVAMYEEAWEYGRR